MAFIFTCGTHTFQSLLKGYENVTVQCHNCGNHSARVYRRWEWFTFCFIPVIPFSLKPWQDVSCSICRYSQTLKSRPDAENSSTGQIPMQPQSHLPGPGGPGGPGGYGQQPPPNSYVPPAGGQSQGGGIPQYK